MLKSRWGLGYFLAAVAVTVLIASFGHSHIHYFTFEAATRHIFRREPAYGFPYEPNTGFATLWVYSPSCALFFFSLFAFLPTALGKFFYLTLSATALVTGLIALASALGQKARILSASFFWVLLSFEAVGSLSAFKIETITTAMTLWAAWALIERRELIAALLLAMITNWKFQGIPIAGLLILSHLTWRRTGRFLLLYLAALAVYSALPYLFLPMAYLAQANHVWRASLTESLAQTWTSYQHIYSTFMQVTGVSLSLASAQACSAVAGLTLAAFAWRQTALAKSRSVATHPYLFAAALGGAFVVIFSPMSQSLAFILWAPLLLAFFAAIPSDGRTPPKGDALILGISAFCVSIAYSDLVPRAVRAFCREVNLKPVGVLILLIALVYKQGLFTRRATER